MRCPLEHLFSPDETRNRKKPEIDATKLYQRLLRELHKAQNEQERALEGAYKEEMKKLRAQEDPSSESGKAETPAANALEAIKLPAESLKKLKDSGPQLVENIFKVKIRHDDANFAERLFLEGFEILENYAAKVPEQVGNTVTNALEYGSQKLGELISNPLRKPEPSSPPEPSEPDRSKLEAFTLTDLADEPVVGLKWGKKEQDTEP